MRGRRPGQGRRLVRATRSIPKHASDREQDVWLPRHTTACHWGRTMTDTAAPQPLPNVTSSDRSEREAAAFIRQAGAGRNTLA